MPKKRGCTFLHVGSCVLSVVAILLTIALFVRLETAVREAKIMDSKFSQVIQQVKETLEKASKPKTSVNNDFDADVGKLLQKPCRRKRQESYRL